MESGGGLRWSRAEAWGGVRQRLEAELGGILRWGQAEWRLEVGLGGVD